MRKILFILLLAPFFVQAQTINTVVGTGAKGYAGDGGPAAAALLKNPGQVAFDAVGNMYIADDSNFCVRKVTPSGIISTFAGNGTSGFSGDGGPATAAQFTFVQSVAPDAAGNVYITDAYNGRVRKVDPSGIITTFAGNGALGSTGDGGPATAAAIAGPTHVTVDAAGNVYITDYWWHNIRKVNTSGIISKVAGSVAGGGFTGDGGQATAARLSSPTGVAVDAAGNIYIADGGNRRIRKIDASGIISTFAGVGLGGYTGDGGPATAAKFRTPQPPTLDGHDNLYFGDVENHVIRRIHLPSGIISTLAGTGTPGFSGDGGPAAACQLWLPTHIGFDAAGDGYITDHWNNRIRKVSDMPVGLPDDVQNTQSVNLFPNPASDEITITADFLITHISLTDVMGRNRYYHHFNRNEVHIDLTDLPAGVYFARVNNVQVKKIIKE